VAEGESGGEKVHDATPKRLQQARERGQVAMSSDLVTAVMLATAGATIFLSGGQLVTALGEFLSTSVHLAVTLANSELEPKVVSRMLAGAAGKLLPPLLLFLAPMAAVGYLLSYGQIGFQLTPKVFEPKLEKFDPIKGFNRILGSRAWMRFLLSLLKLVGIAGTMLAVMWFQLPRLTELVGSDLGPVMRAGITVIAMTAGGAVLALLLISILDVVYQRFQHAKELKMTHEELKREFKESDGSPEVKGRIRRLQRELSQNRMMQDVPDATVVVTNPTHFAVALAYPYDESGEPVHEAPRVVAKGADLVALRIREVAKEHDIVIYEDKPLARALYAQCEVGDSVPPDLFAAVVAVLQYVYRLRPELGRGLSKRRA
jgi:flagellar biosynthetic protein FlhB